MAERCNLALQLLGLCVHIRKTLNLACHASDAACGVIKA